MLEINKFLFTKNEIESIENLLHRKIEDYMLLRQEIGSLYAALERHKRSGDKENYKLCEKEIQRLQEKSAN